MNCTKSEKNPERMDYYSKNLSTFHRTVIKPVLRCGNPQNTKNYDAIQIIHTPIFKIVPKLDLLIPQFCFLLNSKYKGP